MSEGIIWVLIIAAIAWFLLIPETTKDNITDKIKGIEKNATIVESVKIDRNITLGYAPCVTDEQCIAVYFSSCKSGDYNIKNCFCEQTTGLCKLK